MNRWHARREQEGSQIVPTDSHTHCRTHAPSHLYPPSLVYITHPPPSSIPIPSRSHTLPPSLPHTYPLSLRSRAIRPNPPESSPVIPSLTQNLHIHPLSLILSPSLPIHSYPLGPLPLTNTPLTNTPPPSPTPYPLRSCASGSNPPESSPRRSDAETPTTGDVRWRRRR